jgi:hypothetical protein
MDEVVQIDQFAENPLRRKMTFFDQFVLGPAGEAA